MNDVAALEGKELEGGTLAVLNKSEIDQQIATAHRYPRSVANFRKETLQMVTLTDKIAAECIYALPRDGKVIEGPSARFAEVIASAWGNSRAGARIVSESTEFVTAQGVFHDLERNVAITYEVQRRITDKQGRRFKPDMIGVTANAACSIALRNAILKGVPKAFWAEMYDAARLASVGDVKSIANKRADAIKAFAPYNIDEAQILARLGRSGVQDISIDDLITLNGFLTAIKDGDSTPELLFSMDAPGTPTSDAIASINANITKDKRRAQPAPPPPAAVTFAQVADAINKASTPDTLDVAADLIPGVADEQQRAELDVAARAKRAQLQP